jgi:hypothetical protein
MLVIGCGWYRLLSMELLSIESHRESTAHRPSRGILLKGLIGIIANHWMGRHSGCLYTGHKRWSHLRPSPVTLIGLLGSSCWAANRCVTSHLWSIHRWYGLGRFKTTTRRLRWNDQRSLSAWVLHHSWGQLSPWRTLRLMACLRRVFIRLRWSIRILPTIVS